MNPYKYFRIHTKDIAYMTQRPRGLFTAIGRLVDQGILSEAETEQYWQERQWFEAHLPVPDFYKDKNPEGAITWFKDSEAGNGIYEGMTFYKDMANKYQLDLYITGTNQVPGRLIYEDDYQIGVVDSHHEGSGFVTSQLKGTY